MTLVQKNYIEGDYFDNKYSKGRTPPKFYSSRPEISNSKFSLDYIDDSYAYESQIYKYLDNNDKQRCFENGIDELLSKCDMTMQNSLLPSLSLADMYSLKNSKLFTSSITHSGTFDTSLMVKNIIDPQLFSEKDVQIPSVAHKIQLLSPPYPSVQYDKNFINNFSQDIYEKSNQEDIQLLSGHCPQLQNDFKESIHQLSSQVFSPPCLPKKIQL
ncbi:hypothetical protein PCANB_000013 [Pneumocystis canis]|nr:hypothetical protein PCANB_000013 [Pneumocystis canis]